jgi:hypothetical protein
MPGRRNTSFLKRQKEQKRADKAAAKRAARQARRDEKVAANPDEPIAEEPIIEAADGEADDRPD